MKRGTVSLVVLISLLHSVDVRGQRPEPAMFRRFLVPVVDTVGTVQWRATLWLHNNGHRVLHPFPLLARTDTGTAITDAALGDETLMMRNINTVGVRPFGVPLTAGGQGGATIYVERDGGADLVGRIDVSGGNGLPTTVPVVGQDAFKNNFDIEPVPGYSDGRYLLRVYSLDGPEDSTVTVHVGLLYAMGISEIMTATVRLHASPAVLNCFPATQCPWPDLPYTPFFAAVPVPPSIDGRLRYDIHVEAEDPSVRIWGMLTVTTNCGDKGCTSVFVPW